MENFVYDSTLHVRSKIHAFFQGQTHISAKRFQLLSSRSDISKRCWECNYFRFDEESLTIEAGCRPDSNDAVTVINISTSILQVKWKSTDDPWIRQVWARLSTSNKEWRHSALQVCYDQVAGLLRLELKWTWTKIALPEVSPNYALSVVCFSTEFHPWNSLQLFHHNRLVSILLNYKNLLSLIASPPHARATPLTAPFGGKSPPKQTSAQSRVHHFRVFVQHRRIFWGGGKGNSQNKN